MGDDERAERKIERAQRKTESRIDIPPAWKQTCNLVMPQQ
jgi:hypothetical protein